MPLPVVPKRKRRMKLAKKIILGVCLAGTATAAYGYAANNNNSRRTFLNKASTYYITQDY